MVRLPALQLFELNDAIYRHLTLTLSRGLKVTNKINYLSKPPTAGTVKVASKARIVVFTIACSETVPLCRCISMPQIHTQPAFD